jgi:hypothetical protein
MPPRCCFIPRHAVCGLLFTHFTYTRRPSKWLLYWPTSFISWIWSNRNYILIIAIEIQQDVTLNFWDEGTNSICNRLRSISVLCWLHESCWVLSLSAVRCANVPLVISCPCHLGFKFFWASRLWGDSDLKLNMVTASPYIYLSPVLSCEYWLVVSQSELIYFWKPLLHLYLAL